MMIYVPKKELIVPLRLRTRVAGWYKLEAVKLDGRVRPLTGWFPNLITNGGLDNLGSGGYPMHLCAVGTGNTAPAVTNTQLVAQVATTTSIVSASQTNAGSSPYNATLTTTWQFPVGSATGNLAEVGVGVSATNLFSRALIVDGSGNPTTITVLSDEALNVTYQINMYPPLTDVDGSITLANVNYTTVMRAALVTNSNNWGLSTDGNFSGMAAGAANAYATQTLGAITSQPSGSAFAADSGSTGTYTTGTYQQSFTFGWSINAGNTGSGIGSILIALRWGLDAGFNVGGAGEYQISFSPVIPKNNTMVLSLTFQQSWASGT